MGYHEPCEIDPAHGNAIVGINPADGSETSASRWVCVDCFTDYLTRKRKNIDTALGRQHRAD